MFRKSCDNSARLLPVSFLLIVLGALLLHCSFGESPRQAARQLNADGGYAKTFKDDLLSLSAATHRGCRDCCDSASHSGSPIPILIASPWFGQPGFSASITRYQDLLPSFEPNVGSVFRRHELFPNGTLAALRTVVLLN